MSSKLGFKNVLSGYSSTSNFHHKHFLKAKEVTRDKLREFSKKFYYSRQKDFLVKKNPGLNNDIAALFIASPTISPFKQSLIRERGVKYSRVDLDKFTLLEMNKDFIKSVINECYTKFKLKSKKINSIELFSNTLGLDMIFSGQYKGCALEQEIRKFVGQNVIQRCVNLAQILFNKRLIIGEEHTIKCEQEIVVKPDTMISDDLLKYPMLLVEYKRQMIDYNIDQLKTSEGFQQLIQAQILTKTPYSVLTDGHIYYISLFGKDEQIGPYIKVAKLNALNAPGEPSVLGFLTGILCSSHMAFKENILDLDVNQFIKSKEKLAAEKSVAIEAYIEEQKNNLYYSTIDFGQDWNTIKVLDELSDVPKFIIPAKVLLKHARDYLGNAMIQQLTQYKSIVLQILDIERLFHYKVDTSEEFLQETIEEELENSIDDILYAENRASDLQIQPNTNRIALFGQIDPQNKILIKREGLSLCLGPVVAHGSMLKVGDTIGKEKLQEAGDILSNLKKEQLVVGDNDVVLEDHIMEKALIGLNNEVYFTDLKNESDIDLIA